MAGSETRHQKAFIPKVPKVIDTQAQEWPNRAGVNGTNKENGTETPTTIELGEIASPFPWAEGHRINMSLMQDNGSSLLFCEAMSDNARKISDLLRGQKIAARRFSNAWNTIQRTELTDNATTHSAIRRVKVWPDSQYAGLTLKEYRNTKTGERLTYVKTNVNKYARIEELAKKQGIGADAPLVILVVETDKEHQDRTYETEFRRRSAGAKAG